MNFKNLNLINPIIRAATETGYSKPTEIQSGAIPQILKGRDFLGFAPKEKGKIAAFAMPVIQLLKRSSPEHKEIRTLILTPTQELAIQIEEDFRIYSKYLPLSQLTIHDGTSQGNQLAALRIRVDVLITTPTSLLDLINYRPINLSKIEILVLDEADKMLDPSFVNDVKKVLKLIPQKRQTLLFSSTVSDKIRKFADMLLNNPTEIETASISRTEKDIEQPMIPVEKKAKTDRLYTINPTQYLIQ
ncbi:DEAD/DEAH box helicase [Chryseobacterium sp. T16E-39]|uniref:DEAD/DEAH box helicase n=1 Tax=Chryseobacterium sp. T16E-39 TaxID=2015076 RepID=UPI000B5B246F|nr:DEAD/DEAH box helicase [Chryseobacterium sp. T16E-39]ASK32285.1 DEAD/DEAH box helicase [Chryseobacterium sp. T16E-39]